MHRKIKQTVHGSQVGEHKIKGNCRKGKFYKLLFFFNKKNITIQLEDKNYQSELEKSFQEVQKELKKEIRSKAQLEEEVISLRQKLKDIEAKYEEFVNRKDAQLNSHREIDRKEVHLLREQMRELEADLSSKNQLIEVKNQELETYIKESVAQNHKISELEKNLRDAKDQANDYKNLYEKIEATNQNLRQKSKEMSETIKHLQTSLNQAEGKLYENYEKIQVSSCSCHLINLFPLQ